MILTNRELFYTMTRNIWIDYNEIYKDDRFKDYDLTTEEKIAVNRKIDEIFVYIQGFAGGCLQLAMYSGEKELGNIIAIDGDSLGITTNQVVLGGYILYNQNGNIKRLFISKIKNKYHELNSNIKIVKYEKDKKIEELERWYINWNFDLTAKYKEIYNKDTMYGRWHAN